MLGRSYFLLTIIVILILVTGCGGGGGGTSRIHTEYVARELSQDYSRAIEINDKGQIVGGNSTGIVIWGADGQTQQLIQDYSWNEKYAITGINDHGTVLGNQKETSKMLIWSAGSSSPATVSYELDEEWNAVYIKGFNDFNEIVGFVSAGWEHTRAVRWDGNAFKLLETPQEYLDSVASDINDHGLVVGDVANRSSSDPEVSRAAIWDRTGKIKLLTLPANAVSSTACAVNNLSQVVGLWWDGSGNTHAALWDSGGRVKTLSSLPGNKNSRAMDINDNGIIVGYVNNANDVLDYQTAQAVLWTPDNTIISLEHSVNGIWNWAISINNSGVVTGTSVIDPIEMIWHAVVWTPKRQ